MHLAQAPRLRLSPAVLKLLSNLPLQKLVRSSLRVVQGSRCRQLWQPPLLRVWAKTLSHLVRGSRLDRLNLKGLGPHCHGTDDIEPLVREHLARMHVVAGHVTNE